MRNDFKKAVIVITATLLFAVFVFFLSGIIAEFSKGFFRGLGLSDYASGFWSGVVYMYVFSKADLYIDRVISKKDKKK